MNRIFFQRALNCTKRCMSTGTQPPPPSQTSSATTAAPTQEEINNPGKSLNARYRPSDLEKIILVWTKKFKSRDEIPTFVSAELLERSRSQARIKIANIAIFLTALASFGAVLSGKAAAKRGDSVHQMNLDWHKNYQDEFKAKEAAAK